MIQVALFLVLAAIAVAALYFFHRHSVNQFWEVSTGCGARSVLRVLSDGREHSARDIYDLTMFNADPAVDVLRAEGHPIEIRTGRAGVQGWTKLYRHADPGIAREALEEGKTDENA